MKKAIIIILASILLATGCQTKTSSQDVVTDLRSAVSRLDVPDSSEQLHQYDSKYTICYKNADGTYSMYIFASPIQYMNADGYSIICNSIIESDYKNYAYENQNSPIKMYFPSRLTDNFMMLGAKQQFEFRPAFDISKFSEAIYQKFENMYGDLVDAVVYKSDDMLLAFYAANLGIKAEMVFYKKPKESNFQFSVFAPDTTCENKNNGYITFVSSDAVISSIIYAPIMKGSKENYDENSNNLSINSQLSITTKDYKNYLVDFNLDNDFFNSNTTKYPVHCDLTFQMYDNASADSTVYENVMQNYYLKNYAVIGNEPTLGEAWHYFRVRLKYFLKLSPENLISASYNHRELSGFNSVCNVSYDKPNGQWSSSQMLWYSKSEKLKNACKLKVGYTKNFNADITDYSKYELVNDTSEEESYGLIISSDDSNKYRIIATSDNSLYTPYMELKMKELPIKFCVQQNINPD